jgi:hypothetical protein
LVFISHFIPQKNYNAHTIHITQLNSRAYFRFFIKKIKLTD